jgi:hypothetical protein
MGSIYNMAKEVLVWLGNDHAVFSMAPLIDGCIKGRPQPEVDLELETSILFSWNHPYWTRTCTCRAFPNTSVLFPNEYTATGIAQELSVERLIKIIVGPYDCYWHSLQLHLRKFSDDTYPLGARMFCNFIAQNRSGRDTLGTDTM